jgi:hypothetical protein
MAQIDQFLKVLVEQGGRTSTSRLVLLQSSGRMVTCSG